jgi:hypothetical protein
MRRSFIATVVGVVLTLGLSVPSTASQHDETSDILDQGGGPVLVENGAGLIRTSHGLSVRIAMPTPEPGSYTYPTAGLAFSGAGHPEGYSLWAFVFNFPDQCDGPCDANDLGNTPAQGGAFFVAGHLVGGPHLVLSGQVSTQSDPFIAGHAALQNPTGAEVHLAIAPHGGLDPALLPELIKTPTQPSSIWWTARFE